MWALPTPQLPGLAPAGDLPHKPVHVPSLFGDLPGNLVGAHRVVIWLLAEAKVVAQVDKGQGDPEPHAQQGHHGGEGHLQAQCYELSQALMAGCGLCRVGVGRWGLLGPREGEAQQGHHGGEGPTDSYLQGSWPKPLGDDPSPREKQRADAGLVGCEVKKEPGRPREACQQGRKWGKNKEGGTESTKGRRRGQHERKLITRACEVMKKGKNKTAQILYF